jgi:hypothetical protein
MTLKVNNPASVESQVVNGDLEMKKAKAGRGFWDWIMGSGWAGGGASG